MNYKHILQSAGIAVLGVLCLAACSDNKKVEQEKNIVINEIMPSNRTGLLNHKGKAADWIELYNASADSINLKGFQLQVERINPDSISTDKKKIKKEADPDADEPETDKKEKETIMTWTFPDVEIPAKGTLLVFVGKKKDKQKGDDNKEDKKSDKEVVAEVKLPKEGATVRFLSPAGDVIREVKYEALAADQSLARQADNSYKPTYWQSPGFENTRAGYEAAQQKMAEQRNSPLLIWEVMNRAEHSYQNWVELKNVSDKDITLSDYALSKKLSKKQEAWRLPDRILKPGEIITITLAGEKRANGGLNAPFKLGSAETVILSKDDKFVDGVCAKQTLRGGSIGRMKGQKGFFYFSSPTRNAENSSDGRRFIADAPAFDHHPGVYEKGDKLTLRLKDPKQKVHYTINGEAPTSASPLLKDSIVLAKTSTLRTYTEGDSISLRSKTATDTYILGAKHTLPVVTITVNNNDLYNFNTGIYAQGPGYGTEWPHPGANFWKKWTKNAHVELFDVDKSHNSFSVDCGLSIFGGYSRNEDKKSFRLKFRGRYGAPEVEYDFFGDGQPIALKDLVLRSGSQDWLGCMLRDEFFTSLMQAQSPTLLTQKFRPAAVYVNGQYFGLYYLREKIDNNFVARKLNVSNDNIDIIMSKYCELGSKDDYNKLITYVQNNDMTQKAHYNHVKQLVDVQGLVDFKLGEMYAGNADVGNVRYVRSHDPKSDGKWRFVYYDLDATWTGYGPSASFYLSTNAPQVVQQNIGVHNILINRLLNNPEFRQLFLQRLSHHLSTTFSSANAEAVFDKLVAQIRPEMELNCQRWPRLSFDKWEKNLQSFREKFKDKPQVMLNDLREYLKITPEENKKYFEKLGY